MVKVNRQYIDLADKSELTIRENFIESLTHDSYIIQIPQLREKRRNNLEILLSIFDQCLILSGNEHFLNLDEESYPEEFRGIIRRLLKATAEKDVCDTMELEDDILDELESLKRQVLDKDKLLEKNTKTLEDNAKIIKNNTKTINNALAALIDSGMTLDAAKKILDIPL